MCPRTLQGPQPSVVLARPATSTSGSAAGTTATTRAAFRSPTAIRKAGARKGRTKKVRRSAQGGLAILAFARGLALRQLHSVWPADKKPKEEQPAPKDGEGSPKGKEKDGEVKPRALHKTCSLFVRNIAPNIPQAEIVTVSVALRERRPGLGRRDSTQRAVGFGGPSEHMHPLCFLSFAKDTPAL